MATAAGINHIHDLSIDDMDFHSGSIYESDSDSELLQDLLQLSLHDVDLAEAPVLLPVLPRKSKNLLPRLHSVRTICLLMVWIYHN